jgi:DNA-binding MarR family transcriptional regulator
MNRATISTDIFRHQRMQSRRATLFGADLFRDPAWDMLLELYRCALIGRAACTTHAFLASGVPCSTAKRHLDLLCTAGLVQRHPDPRDQRRTFLTLTNRAQRAFFTYFGGVAGLPCPVPTPTAQANAA